MSDFTSMRVPIPPCRDPFVNAQLVDAGRDPLTGVQRFWCSTFNGSTGSTGVLVGEDGSFRLYPFQRTAQGDNCGFYGAVYAGDETMWLGLNLDKLYRLNLRTGEMSCFETGLPCALASSAISYDERTGKIFNSTYAPTTQRREGFCFDTRAQKVHRLYHDLPLSNNVSRCSLRMKNGKFLICSFMPDAELFTWDPQTDEIDLLVNDLKIDEIDHCGRVVMDEDEDVYVPYNGWFSVSRRKFTDKKRAPVEAAWFARKDDNVYGLEYLSSGNALLKRWNIKTGAIHHMHELPDTLFYGCRLSDAGKIVCVNMYGYFYRINPENDHVDCFRDLDVRSVQSTDCVRRIDENTILGTSFISQRFWTADIRTGEGVDQGRATAGCGEVLVHEEMNGKIYMASYTQGEMSCFDPKKPVRFPENPAVVVHPPRPALRPVCSCKDTKNLYYSCSHEYGHDGCMMIRYNTATGESYVADDPIPMQMVTSLHYDAVLDTLVAGSTFNSDCRSGKAREEICYVLRLDPYTLLPTHTRSMPQGTEFVDVLGKLDTEHYLLCCLNGAAAAPWHYPGTPVIYWRVLNINTMELQSWELPQELKRFKRRNITGTGKDGLFVCDVDGNICVWDLKEKHLVYEIAHAEDYYTLLVQGDSIYLIGYKDVQILDHCLRL